MLFNLLNCKCLHTVHVNEDAYHTMSGTILNTIVKENNLGFTINGDMKVSE